MIVRQSEQAALEKAWLDIGASEDFGAGCHLVQKDDRRLVLAILDGRMFVFDAICPHAYGPMHLAEIEDTIVSCPLHAWRFDLARGGRELHGYRGLPTYEVKLENGRVFVGDKTACE